MESKSPIKKPKLNVLATKLVADGFIDEDTAYQAVTLSDLKNTSFVSHLVENRLIEPIIIAKTAALDFGIPLLDLESFDTESMPVELLNESLIKTHNVLPLFKRGQRLYIAVSDPSKQSTLDEIKYHTGLHATPILVEENKLHTLIEKALSQKDQVFFDDLDDADLDVIDINTDDDELEAMDSSGQRANEAPIVRFVHKILLDAINSGASDVHLEPYENQFRIRFRQDGILHEKTSPPINLASRITTRLKVMSQLDISERRIPQDGRFKMRLSKARSIDFRISTCPTVNGEKIVIRILDPSSAYLDIDHLGFNKSQKKSFLDGINRPQGMVLVTGPTGSGKTVTLYTALNILNTTEQNISTAEDPVEIKLNGINQVNINLKTNLTFSNVLRSFLRQDPDIIMVGEMRDLETAEIGIKAAQTGHLVLTTLHTNSAPETLSRLAYMGVAPYNIASSVSLIIAQRLARQLCEHCKEPTKLPEQTLLQEGFEESALKKLKIFSPKGCDQCTGGYKGRIGLFEVLPVTNTVSEAIMLGKSAMEIAELAKSEGMKTLRQSGLEKVAEGATSLDELNRVTKD